jgi:hypothetical protein
MVFHFRVLGLITYLDDIQILWAGYQIFEILESDGYIINRISRSPLLITYLITGLITGSKLNNRPATTLW